MDGAIARLHSPEAIAGPRSVDVSHDEKTPAHAPLPPLTPAELQTKMKLIGSIKVMRNKYPYLALPEHELYPRILACDEAIQDHELDRACDLLVRVEEEVEQEAATLEAAFDLFRPPGKTELTEKEIGIMLEYLGFPATSADVDKLLKALDADGDRRLNLVEFQLYVGRMGGSFRLFEMRRKQMAAKTGLEHGKDSVTDREHALEERQILKQAGIGEGAQAYWRLVVPHSEFREAALLVDCQQKALRHIRALAKSNHEQALPKLQNRMLSLKFEDSHLWMTLAFIRELAPIIVHLNLTKMIPFLEKDTHYRNQFETQTSGGLLKPSVREKWERNLFGGTYEKAKGFERCKYGVLNVMNDHRGVVKCHQYGDSYIVLKDTRLRCTLSPEDSANLKAERLAVLDYYAHVLVEYSDAELEETVKVATSGEAAMLGDSSRVGAMKYKETQIHGEICYARHVERLVASVKHRSNPDEKGRLEAICRQYGWTLSWMDEERTRMQKEEREHFGAEAWLQKLEVLMAKSAVPDAAGGVPPGKCKKGCGRDIAPGLTKSGKPYDTCCRGCVMGFGHDMRCGNKALSAPGMCINGCGKPAADDFMISGRAYTTCCRSCKRGTHDNCCGQPASNSNIEPGLCRMGCSKPVAKAKDGKKYDTCCRGCVRGLAHSAECGK